ncbi:MAG: phage holin family protein [Fusobacteriaceae bacterium]
MTILTLEILFVLFFVAICFDFVSGLLAAAKEGKLKSRSCSSGIYRTMGECLVLLMFITIYKLVPQIGVILSTFTLWFILKEGISIIENLIRLEVNIHPGIVKMFEVGVEKTEQSTYNKNNHNKGGN